MPEASGSGDGGDPNGTDRADDPSSQSPATVEKLLMLCGVVTTLLVLGYLGWHVAAPPPSEPLRATVDGTETLSDGRVAVRIRLHVPHDTGYVSATVSASCTDPPPTAAFSNLPEASTWTGTIVCPAGTADPVVSVGSWEVA